MARPKAPLELTDDNREVLKRFTRRRTTSQGLALRSRIVLESATGATNTAVAAKVLICGPIGPRPFKPSTDPQFVDKVRDIVGLYLDPPDKAVVLAVNEKSQIQALDRSQPVFPMLPGTPQRATHDYIRHGTTTLFREDQSVTPSWAGGGASVGARTSSVRSWVSF